MCVITKAMSLDILHSASHSLVVIGAYVSFLSRCDVWRAKMRGMAGVSRNNEGRRREGGSIELGH